MKSKLLVAYFNSEELKWLQICEFLIEINFILYLNTTLFYNFMLPVNRYLANLKRFMRDLYSIKYNILKLHSIIKGGALFTVGYTIFGNKYEIIEQSGI
jgi:hypothetical protein